MAAISSTWIRLKRPGPVSRSGGPFPRAPLRKVRGPGRRCRPAGICEAADPGWPTRRLSAATCAAGRVPWPRDRRSGASHPPNRLATVAIDTGRREISDPLKCRPDSRLRSRGASAFRTGSPSAVGRDGGQRRCVARSSRGARSVPGHCRHPSLPARFVPTISQPSSRVARVRAEYPCPMERSMGFIACPRKSITISQARWAAAVR